MIQSTMRRPRIGWRCFGKADFIRVPSPPAITTAASDVPTTRERLEKSHARPRAAGRPPRGAAPRLVWLRCKCRAEAGHVAGVPPVGRNDEVHAGMVEKVHISRADEEAPVGKHDLLGDAGGDDSRRIAIAVE